MGALLAAVVILCIISIFSKLVRSYMSFCLLITGVAMVIAGLIGIGKDNSTGNMWLYMGIASIAVSLLAAFLSSLKVERSQRPHFMFSFFLYGFLTFFKIIFYTMIITIPLATFFGRIAADYKEVIVVDEYGRERGTAYVDKHGRGSDGKRYDPYGD
ncbi:MAG: hypothetical protein E7647_00185 [Ruminococcaceae bacterium]|nr:hypothetical protein [Oscillospiraceae bacterium]